MRPRSPQPTIVLELPTDPALALDALRDSGAEAPPLVRVDGESGAVFDALHVEVVAGAIEGAAAAGSHRERALIVLYATLRDGGVALADESILTDIDRMRPLAVEFFHRVGSLAARVGGDIDPVRSALLPAGRRLARMPRPHGSQPVDTPSPAVPTRQPRTRAAASPYTARRPEAVAPQDGLDRPPAEVIEEVRTALAEGEISTKGKFTEAYQEVVGLATERIVALTGCHPVQARQTAEVFVKAVTRTAKLRHGALPHLDIGRLTPHLIHYLGDSVPQPDTADTDGAAPVPAFQPFDTARPITSSWHNLNMLIDEDPGALVDELYAALAERRISQTGTLSQLCVPIARELATRVGAMTERDPAALIVVLEGFMRRLSSYVRTETGRSWGANLTTDRLLPHALHYIEDLGAQEEARGPHELPISPEAIGQAEDILNRPPRVLLNTIRQAITQRQFGDRGAISGRCMELVDTLIPTVMEATGYKPGDARAIARHLVRAISRLVRFETGGTPWTPNMTPDRLLPHLTYYLREAAHIQNAHLPAPYRRALQYTPAELNGLYDYWVNTKSMPSWAFEYVAYSSYINIDARMQALFNTYGTDVPPVRNLGAPSFYHAPTQSQKSTNHGEGEVSLLDFIADAGPQPDEALIHTITRHDVFANLSTLLRDLPPDDALAIVVTYDLPLAGGQDIDIDALAARLGTRAAGLPRYVSQQVLPALRAIADRKGLDFSDF
jgi:hypothetical protein